MLAACLQRVRLNPSIYTSAPPSIYPQSCSFPRRSATQKKAKIARIPKYVTAKQLQSILKGDLRANRITLLAANEHGLTRGKNVTEMILPFKIAKQIVQKHAPTFTPIYHEADLLRRPAESISGLAFPPRQPVVTVMGHIDHGKTSLLDALRGTNVAALEPGGITQSISAFEVPLDGTQVTFLDTPGHGIFHIMRETGSSVADIVLLVVAADEGIKPQTLESIAMAAHAGVPLVAAINKIDLKKNLAPVRQQLKKLTATGTPVKAVVEISATKRLHLDALKSALLKTAAEINPRADRSGFPEATVVEAIADASKGCILRAIVHSGTLEVGQFIISGTHYGRIRHMYNDQGKPVQSALPGQPVQIVGLRDLPIPGDAIFVNTKAKVEEVAEYRKLENAYIDQHPEAEVEDEEEVGDTDVEEEEEEEEEEDEAASAPARRKEGALRIPVVIKADNVSVLASILDACHRLSTPDIDIDVVHSGVGNVKPRDVRHAAIEEETKCPILCFNVNADRRVMEEAKQEGVDVKIFTVVFDLFDEIRRRINAAGVKAPKEKLSK